MTHWRFRPAKGLAGLLSWRAHLESWRCSAGARHQLTLSRPPFTIRDSPEIHDLSATLDILRRYLSPVIDVSRGPDGCSKAPTFELAVAKTPFAPRQASQAAFVLPQVQPGRSPARRLPEVRVLHGADDC